MNEKSPRSPLNGPSRVSAGIVPGGNTRGGPAATVGAVSAKYSAATITAKHPWGQRCIPRVDGMVRTFMVVNRNQSLETSLPIGEELLQPARIIRQRFDQIAGLAGIFREVEKVLVELVAVLAPEVFEAALADGLPGAIGAT